MERDPFDALLNYIGLSFLIFMLVVGSPAIIAILFAIIEAVQ